MKLTLETIKQKLAPWLMALREVVQPYLKRIGLLEATEQEWKKHLELVNNHKEFWSQLVLLLDEEHGKEET